MTDKWKTTKDENDNDIYTWEAYEVRKVYAKKATSANYLNPKERPTYTCVGSWRAKHAGQFMDTDTNLTQFQLMASCEQHNQYLSP